MTADRSYMSIEVNGRFANYFALLNVLELIMDKGHCEKADVYVSYKFEIYSYIVRIYNVSSDTAAVIGKYLETTFGKDVQWMYHEAFKEE